MSQAASPGQLSGIDGASAAAWSKVAAAAPAGGRGQTGGVRLSSGDSMHVSETAFLRAALEAVIVAWPQSGISCGCRLRMQQGVQPAARWLPWCGAAALLQQGGYCAMGAPVSAAQVNRHSAFAFLIIPADW